MIELVFFNTHLINRLSSIGPTATEICVPDKMSLLDYNTDGLNDPEPNGGSSSSSNASDYEVIPNPDFYGHPVQIVKVTDERKFELDVEALGNILLRDSIRDTPVVVVSIAGDFRKGMAIY